ncbi:hypothetical protein HQN90_17870 [Paenibacillus alba]|uniref:hypothetical protein n=1 Tax=Paenibacillus alba TaxID=1197127 RepID=UPI001565FC05|nr:hypothetical protein [Paenibacillus alba]NQX67993.1 hypothetical protein [Paenibacillus alba]
MTNPLVVQVIAERIMSGGINPKTAGVYTLDEITNEEYKKAVVDYIATVSPQI